MRACKSHYEMPEGPYIFVYCGNEQCSMSGDRVEPEWCAKVCAEYLAEIGTTDEKDDKVS